ncbi:uncharacterized protein B0H18DRAFT_634129 [Fomitopsis serialis]|uniref:uncharacterized protein n=1 Tax=Fomitopsis serialis TaxID=139415 RepID=UPI002007D905|nr:uncharacterized protein B0H18DRAFT_634129 [Neoantrodia serialis]KAH9919566.1 hypothetical protein B0H18DRAFT_634129 [Neoantrodia serialis]
MAATRSRWRLYTSNRLAGVVVSVILLTLAGAVVVTGATLHSYRLRERPVSSVGHLLPATLHEGFHCIQRQVVAAGPGAVSKPALSASAQRSCGSLSAAGVPYNLFPKVTCPRKTL